MEEFIVNCVDLEVFGIIVRISVGKLHLLDAQERRVDDYGAATISILSRSIPDPAMMLLSVRFITTSDQI